MSEEQKLQNKNKVYIGIDPDTVKNGVCLYTKKDGIVGLANDTFWDLIGGLIGMKNAGFDFKVIIEGGWLNKKSNWHGSNRSGGEKIAKNVGMNHQVGHLLVEFCQHYNIEHEVVPPKKLIRGKKIDAKTFKSITKYKGRTNQETRDAAMLVFGL